MAAGAAHLMEHVAFQYRKEIEKQLGASLPPPPDFDGEDEEIGHLPPEIEVQLSQLAAVAAGRLLQKDQAEAQQQQAQQQAQDPLVQMQQMDLQIKKQLADLKAQEVQMEAQIKQQELQISAAMQQAEQERKAKKDLIDAHTKADEIELKKTELQLMLQIEQSKLAASSARDADRLNLDTSKHATDTTLRYQDMLGRLAAQADTHAANMHKHDTNIAHQKEQEQTRQMHEGGMTTMKHDHERAMQAEDHALQTNQAASDRIHDIDMEDAARRHEVAMARQTAHKSAKKEGE